MSDPLSSEIPGSASSDAKQIRQAPASRAQPYPDSEASTGWKSSQ